MYSKDDILKQADQLTSKIQDLDLIKSYQNIEKQIHENRNIESKMNRLKNNKSNLLIFKIMGNNMLINNQKMKLKLEDEINELPIVEEFRSAQYEANDLLQLMISTMEDRLNEHNEEEHKD